MRILKKTALLLLATLAPHAALAADFPATPPPVGAPVTRYVAPLWSWTGFYIGVNGGYGSAAGSSVITVPSLGYVTAGSFNGVNGFLAGGQAGVNYQTGMFVVGAEGDYQWAGLSKNLVYGCGFACTVTEKMRLTSFGTLRGRLGVAIDRVLIYGTAGAAYITASDEATFAVGLLNGSLGKVSLSGWGWTAGGGVEVALPAGFTAKGEYLYLSTSSLTGQGNIALVGPVQLDVKAHAHIGRVGVNYKF